MQTIFGSFNDRRKAQRALDQLLARGFPNARIHLHTRATSDRPGADTAADRGMMGHIANFFSNLFAELDEKEHTYNRAEAVWRSNSVVAVDTQDDSEVQVAESIMGQLGTIDVDNSEE